MNRKNRKKSKKFGTKSKKKKEEKKKELEDKIEIKNDYSYSFSKWCVNSFQEAIDYNIKFLRNELLTSPYHAAPVYDMDVMKLLFINKNGILTIEGQSGECYYNVYRPSIKNVYYYNDKIENIKITNSGYFFLEQKPYIVGYIQPDIKNKFINFLNLNNKEGKILYLIRGSELRNKKLISNFTESSIWVTRDYFSKTKIDDISLIPWEYESHISADSMTKFSKYFICNDDPPTIKHFPTYTTSRIHIPTYEFTIIINESCEFNCEDLLVKFIKSIDEYSNTLIEKTIKTTIL